jgi:hypothetical protein
VKGSARDFSMMNRGASGLRELSCDFPTIDEGIRLGSGCDLITFDLPVTFGAVGISLSAIAGFRGGAMSSRPLDDCRR